MFCKHCGNELNDNAIVCMKCGCDPRMGSNFCPNCGANTNEHQIACIKCGCPLNGATTSRRPSQKSPSSNSSKSRVTAGLLGLFLGIVGANQFYLGNTSSGFIHLAISLVTCGWAGGILGLIEGIIYLSMSDAEFDEKYVQNKRGWF